jgi:hypothetical protein
VSAGVWCLECDVMKSKNICGTCAQIWHLCYICGTCATDMAPVLHMCGTCATDMAPVLRIWHLCYGYGGVLLTRRLRCVVEEVEAGGLDRAVRVVACPRVSEGERRR